MSHIILRCTRCTEQYKPDVETLICKECSSPLDVEYIKDREFERTPKELDRDRPRIELPINNDTSVISIGEGNTPIVSLAKVGSELGLDRLYGKLEYLNPTGSYKDRGTSIMLAVVKEHGVTEIAEDSSGNAGASVAAYAARSKMYAHIFVPASATEAKLKQIKMYGAEIHTIDGPREAATEAAISFCRERGVVYASHALSPYFAEGIKSFAYETYHHYSAELPDHIVFPIGNGGLFLGAWKGFQELYANVGIDRIPRLHGVQSNIVMPIVSAFQGLDWDAKQTNYGTTVAGGISVTMPPRQHQVLHTLRETSGHAVGVDDPDILRFQKLLAETEGIYAEPTSAASFAGLEKLIYSGVINKAEVVLVPITGTGLKG